MFSLAQQVRNALQPLVRRALDLDPSERLLWLRELRVDCPTVARELERLMPPVPESSPDPCAGDTLRAVVPGSLEHLGLRC